MDVIRNRIAPILGLSLCERYVPQSRSRQALRHARRGASTRTNGCAYDDAHKYERGGLLPMAAFLTKNAPGLRTSPVKRGNWVVEERSRRSAFRRRRPTVPELPRDEAKLRFAAAGSAGPPSQRRELRRLPCPLRFARPGLRRLRPDRRTPAKGSRRPSGRCRRHVPRRRRRDPASKACGATSASSRQNDFVDNLCGKLLSYALGRSLAICR